MIYILYNPAANNNRGEDTALGLKNRYEGQETSFLNVCDISDMRAFLSCRSAEDTVILAGGDGTLNHFVNDIDDEEYPFPICYYPAGSGNDFCVDVTGAATADVPFDMRPYLRALPTVTVNGKDYKFINGIGYGIDGYCCEVGDKLRETSDKPVNYAGIAIKGLLFHFKPCAATVVVDGKEYKYKKVWLAPTMNGRYYGGGMKVTPEQNRLNEERTVSVCVMHGSGKLKTLCVFPSIFKGEHVKHGEMVSVHTGKNVTVRFERPCALQIDGETVLGVTEYTVTAKVPATV